jgi:hypothetical protein
MDLWHLREPERTYFAYVCVHCIYIHNIVPYSKPKIIIYKLFNLEFSIANFGKLINILKLDKTIKIKIDISILICFYLWFWYSGPCAFQVGVLPLEPYS